MTPESVPPPEWFQFADRLIRWVKREVNRDLTAFRKLYKFQPSLSLADQIDDCLAKKQLIGWAESWAYGRTNNRYDPHIDYTLDREYQMIIFALQYVTGAYCTRPGYQPEWQMMGRLGPSVLPGSWRKKEKS